ncbi:MAG: cobyrinic acid a,c-diamide synthase [Thalassobius sp.]|nr:cobyrinic acid a,c-diamide synthase [Thalassovita sp.]
MKDFATENIPQFMVAAPASNCGKTTLTLGLLSALKAKGLSVQPFKCGPDYLDTQLHTKASGQQSINLDLFFSSENHVKELYSQYAHNKQATVVESVMGLFDGANRGNGSSANISKLLNIPVILVVDARAMAYSVAPLLYGYKNFDPTVNIAGVIFNFVNTDSHYQYLQAACKDVGIRSFGYVPKNETVKIPGRHLGLVTSPDLQWNDIFTNLSNHIAKHLDLDEIIEATSKPVPVHPTQKNTNSNKQLKIAISKDEAFSFTYYENLKALEALGEITFFSPLHDKELPKVDFVYLSGGYPELYLEKLSANKTMLQSIKNYCDQGGRVLAECGGMMYLGKAIEDREGNAYNMANFFDYTTSMAQPKLSLGYRKFFIKEQEFRGHEFHYSNIIEHSAITTCGDFKNATDLPTGTKLFRKNNVWASYMHFYWGEKNETDNYPIIGEILS